jgi:hypothetical protein
MKAYIPLLLATLGFSSPALGQDPEDVPRGEYRTELLERGTKLTDTTDPDIPCIVTYTLSLASPFSIYPEKRIPVFYDASYQGPRNDEFIDVGCDGTIDEICISAVTCSDYKVEESLAPLRRLAELNPGKVDISN